MDFIRPIGDYPWQRIRRCAFIALPGVAAAAFWPGWTGAIDQVSLANWALQVATLVAWVWTFARLLGARSITDQVFYYVVVMPALGLASRYAIVRDAADVSRLLDESSIRVFGSIGAVLVVLHVVERWVRRRATVGRTG